MIGPFGSVAPNFLATPDHRPLLSLHPAQVIVRCIRALLEETNFIPTSYISPGPLANLPVPGNVIVIRDFRAMLVGIVRGTCGPGHAQQAARAIVTPVYVGQRNAVGPNLPCEAH